VVYEAPEFTMVIVEGPVEVTTPHQNSDVSFPFAECASLIHVVTPPPETLETVNDEKFPTCRTSTSPMAVGLTATVAEAVALAMEPTTEIATA
jgi:hypothetical protein